MYEREPTFTNTGAGGEARARLELHLLRAVRLCRGDNVGVCQRLRARASDERERTRTKVI